MSTKLKTILLFLVSTFLTVMIISTGILLTTGTTDYLPTFLEICGIIGLIAALAVGMIDLIIIAYYLWEKTFKEEN